MLAKTARIRVLPFFQIDLSWCFQSWSDIINSTRWPAGWATISPLFLSHPRELLEEQGDELEHSLSHKVV